MTTAFTLCFAVALAVCQASCPAGKGNKPPRELEEAYELLGDQEGAVIEDKEDPALKDSKSMRELIAAVTADKMTEDLFKPKGAKASALAILNHILAETSLDREYLTNVFYSIAKVENDEELDKKKYTESGSLKFLTKVMHHFQANPKAGRPAGEKEEEDQQEKEEEDQQEKEEEEKKEDSSDEAQREEEPAPDKDGAENLKTEL